MEAVRQMGVYWLSPNVTAASCAKLWAAQRFETGAPDSAMYLGYQASAGGVGSGLVGGFLKKL